MKVNLILASGSPNRKSLLETIGLVPTHILPADIDETEYPKELPKNVVSRLAYQKALKVASEIENGYIIGADTVAAIGRRILPKAISDELVIACLEKLSGRRHALYTGFTIIKKIDDKMIAQRSKIVKTILKFKTLTADEIADYVSSKEGIDKAGGYAIQGRVQAYVEYISGSFSNIVGLPLCEFRGALNSLGYYRDLK